MSRLRTHATVAALFVGLAGAEEGLVQTAYPDPGTHGKPWTICYGHTGDVHPGDRVSVPDCKALLIRDGDLHADAMERCTNPAAIAAMPDKRYVAFADFVFNEGPGHYCRSIAPLVNAGQTRAACDKLLEFEWAAKRILRGLVRRRQRERAFCLEGLPA